MRQMLVILCSLIGSSSGGGVLPDSVNALMGDSVRFTTSLAPTGTPFATILWTFEGAIIVTLDYTAPEYEGRVTLDTSTGSLELRDLALSDFGVYAVTIIPTNDGLKTGTTTLNIYEPVSKPRVTASSTDLVEFNDTVSLFCSASGSSLSFLWFNGSAEVKPSDRVHFTYTNVTIDPVLRYDQGSYTCGISNPVSSSTSDPIPLSVNYGPDVILETSPSGEDHEKGSNVILSCSADSRPPAQIKWFLNGTLQSNTGPQWTLSNIQMDQSGTYSCEAFNSETLRNIRSQPTPISVWVRITNVSLKTTSDQPVEGTSVNLTCEASGSILTREWMINGTELKPSKNIQFYNEKQVLSLTNLNRQDSGTYTCNISNPVSSQSDDYTMKVNYGAENVKISGPTEIQEGATLTLSCSADSEPAAKYTWTLNGTTLLQTGSEYTKHKISFSDSGEYICRATNEVTAKASEASCVVTVTEAPGNGLSTGAIAGITVASLVVVAGAAAGGYYLYQHKKDRKKMNNGRELEHVYENTSNIAKFSTDEENKHVYENCHNEYDRKL